MNDNSDHRLTAVYADRNAAVIGFAAAAWLLGWPVWVALDAKDPDPDWPVLFIETPGGQISYHLPAADLRGLAWQQSGDPWDGHDTAEKHQRIRTFVNEIMAPRSPNEPVI